MGDFVTAAEIASYAQVPSVDTSTADLLIAGTEAAARRCVGWNITEETVTDQVVKRSWIQGRFIFLPTAYLSEVTSLSVSGVVSVLGTAYDWHEGGYIESLSSFWTTTRGAITWSGKHGYPAGHQALDDAKDIIGSAVARRIGNPEVLASLRVGGVEETFATGPQLPSIALTRMEKDELREAFGLLAVA